MTKTYTLAGTSVALLMALGLGVAVPMTARAHTDAASQTLFAQVATVLQSLLATITEYKLKTDSPAANLRVVLNALERQHVDLAAAATRAGFDGRAEFPAAAAELDKNSVAIAAAVGSIYGKPAEVKFLEIWRSHITFFVDYTVAAKGGDTADMNKAVQNLGGYVDAISDFLSGANPNLPRAAVHQLVSEHVTLLKGAVDAHGAGKYAESYDMQSKAYTQIGTIADALAGAIVKQNPSKF